MNTATLNNRSKLKAKELIPCEFLVTPLVELIYSNKVKPSDRPLVISSDDAYKLLSQTWDWNKIDIQEQFKVLLLNRKNRVLGLYELSVGGVTDAIADPKLIFTAALKANACAIMLAHNHPSGEVGPSRCDEALTRKIVQGGKLLDIDVLDHLIISRYGYYSFASNGLI